MLTPADALALTMVAVLAFALGSIATLFLIMGRHGKRNEGRLELPEQEESDEKKPKSKPLAPQSENGVPLDDWEKEADWWK